MMHENLRTDCHFKQVLPPGFLYDIQSHYFNMATGALLKHELLEGHPPPYWVNTSGIAKVCADKHFAVMNGTGARPPCCECFHELYKDSLILVPITEALQKLDLCRKHLGHYDQRY
eukprot:gb/GEZN01027010.1/.p1 GENE.gb/GEZN01027010.1/~~gb/GEZN01027010.1/.p1  ORF type:complete len:116 (-),score=5.55 gb/GEZN01027010.1/:76-423(-)